MNQNAKARIGIVGTGAAGMSYVQAFRQCKAAKLAGVADLRRESAEAVAASANCRSFVSGDAMADALSLDAAIVCTPPASHAETCCQLIQRGIPVLCEKPLAINSQTAKQMLGAARDHGVLLSMASKFRHVADVVQAKAIVNSGILGDILLLENVFTSRVDMSSRWNSDPEISGGGVLIDNGTHSVDLMRFFLGPLSELQVVGGKSVQGLPVEETVRVFVRTADGVMGSIDLSWSMNKEQPFYLSLYGSAGTLLVGWKESKYLRSQDDDWIVFGTGYDKVQAFSDQIDNFVHAIRGEQNLVVTPEDALASVEAIESAYVALRHSPWNKIAEGPA